MAAHRTDEAGDLVARFAFAAQRNEQRRGLDLAGVTAHHEIERGFCLRCGQAFAHDQPLNRGGQVVERLGTSGLVVFVGHGR